MGIVGISLSDRLVATSPGVMMEQPDPRGITRFCVAIFSVATQFELEDML